MHSQRLFFHNPQGMRLAARLDLPGTAPPRAYALLAHCFTCSKSFRAAAHISHALTDGGIGVLRFDFTGLGESEGDFADTNFSSNVEDLIAAADFLAREFAAPRLLIGHSLGGAAVLQAAARIPSALAVATIAAPADPEHVTGLFGEKKALIERQGEAEVVIEGRAFRIKRQFLEDLRQPRMQETVRNLKRALLVLHSPRDTVVEIENAARIYQAAVHPKSFVSLDQADHLLSDPHDARYVGGLIAVWAARYLEDAPSARQTAPAAPEVVVWTGRDRYRTEVSVRGHGLLADEPAGVGGTDLGPTPHELLLAALGACTGITLRMYADRKGWPLEAVEVRLRDSETRPAADPRARIERALLLSGPLSEEQRARLLDIANKCPVHRLLSAGAAIETRLQPPGTE